MKKTFLLFLLVAGVATIIIFYTTKKIEKISPSAIATASYYCDNNQTITASFYEGETVAVNPGEPPIPTGSVKLTLSDGRKLELDQTISASGVRYANSNESFIFWNKGDDALVLENNIEKNYINCVARLLD